MSNNLFNKVYNPDVLSCLANLSNDEVFTPPEIVNQMLDTLPQDLFCNPDTKFLDPACKTGVFLREIAKRLIKGLENQFPDLQERVDHIFKNQLYGIAITELTSLLSRRGVYCSKYPNSEFSVTKFDSAEGNIRFKRIDHTWKDGKCIYCGANKEQYNRGEDLETYAYEFIHKITEKELLEMKFDVIISNPPYQLNVGIQQESYAIPIYQYFVKKAMLLKPRYLTMITPSRWLLGGRGLDEFRDEMLNDKRIRVLHDYINASDCFNGVEIKGGVCYFLWERDNEGECEIYTHKNNIFNKSKRYLLENGSDTFIRYNEAISIIKKVQLIGEKSFSNLVSPQTPFGLYSSFDSFAEKVNDNQIKVYANKKIGFLPLNYNIVKNKEWIKNWKVYVPKAIGSGDMSTDIIRPIVGEPNSLCTQTYLMIGPLQKKEECENVVSYINTKFFHFLVGTKKVTQDAMSKVYQFVPMQDFSKPWTDEELYAKYNLSQEEIDFIEAMIKPME